MVLVLFFVGQIALISSLVNFGALFAFCLLDGSVVRNCIARKKSKNYLLHLVVLTLGFLIIGYVLFNADSLTKIGGIVWLGVGAVVFVDNKVGGRVCRNWATIGRFPRIYAISHTPSDAVLCTVTHLRSEASHQRHPRRSRRGCRNEIRCRLDVH